MNSISAPNAAQKKLLNKLNKAINFLNGNDLKQARTICRSITKTNPSFSHGWHILALVEKQSGQLKRALYAFEKAIQAEPSNPNFLYNLAVTYHEAGMVDQAIQSYLRTLKLNGNNPAALDNLGTLYQQQSNFEEALALHQEAVLLQPTPSAYNNLGECHRKLNQPELAIQAYQKALEMMPNFAGALKNLGNLYKEMGEFEKANEYLKQAVIIEQSVKQNEDNVDALWNQATLLLLQGRFDEGWPKYDFGIQQGTRTFIDYGYQVWQREDIEKETILLIGEQGIGDEIMFASCFDDMIHCCHQVIIECDPRLVPMFQRSFTKATVIARGDEETFAKFKQEKIIHYQLPAGSLPNHFRRHQDEFPQRSRFLQTDPKLVQEWRKRLSALGDQIKIGIAWRGGRGPMIIQKRSTPLSLWQSLFQNIPAHFINLQYGDCREDIDWVWDNYAVKIHDFDDIDPLKEMDNYAALVDSLDLIISIDNSVVHLAGSLGKSAWVLLPYIPDWRWQMDTQSSVWYRSIKLFRQTDKDNWQPVFTSVEQQLKQSIQQVISASLPENSIKADQKRALLLNDTSSWYHWGCTCTSGALLHQLSKMGYITDTVSIQDTQSLVYAPNSMDDLASQAFQQQFIGNNQSIIKKIHDSDVVVLNGEGSLHGVSRQVLTQLLLVKIAKENFGKEVHIINHSCYPEDSDQIGDSNVCQMYQSIYTKMDSIAIREPLSAKLMEKMGVNVIQSFDCLPLYMQQNGILPIKDKKDYVVISGSVILSDAHIDQIIQLMTTLHQRGLNLVVLTGAKAYPAREDEYLIGKLKQQATIPWQWIDAKSAEEWLRVIGEAQLLVSGRFHHSIAAAFLKTPFIALSSNTPKMNGMLQMLSLPKPISMDSAILSTNLSDMVIEAIKHPTQWLASDKTLEKLYDYAHKNFSSIKVV